MITVEQAIEYLEASMCDKKQEEGIDNEVSTLANEVLTLAIDALKSQLPMKVNVREWIYTVCPNCDEELSKHHGDGYYSIPKRHKWCPYCRQMLDWNSDKEEDEEED